MDQINNNLNPVQKRRFFNAFLFVIVLLAVFLGVKAVSAIKEYGYIGSGYHAENVIAVSGTGEVFAVPDIGTFSFSVNEEGKTVKEAQDKSSTKINPIIDALKGMGIDEKDIKTTGYNSNPKYEYNSIACTNGYCPPGRQTLVGYQVSQEVAVKIRKTDTAGDVLTKVGSLGASNISGLNFVVDDITAVQAQARTKAIDDAKAKAKVLSNSLGVSLKRIVNFYESGNQPIYYGYDTQSKGGLAVAPEAALPPQVPTGENKITSNVTITYEIK